MRCTGLFPSHVEGSHSLVRIKPTDKQEKEEGLLVTLFPFLKPSSGCLNSCHGHHEPEESSSMKSDLSCWIEKGHRISQTFLLSTQLPCTYFMILIIVVNSLFAQWIWWRLGIVTWHGCYCVSYSPIPISIPVHLLGLFEPAEHLEINWSFLKSPLLRN